GRVEQLLVGLRSGSEVVHDEVQLDAGNRIARSLSREGEIALKDGPSRANELQAGSTNELSVVLPSIRREALTAKAIADLTGIRIRQLGSGAASTNMPSVERAAANRRIQIPLLVRKARQVEDPRRRRAVRERPTHARGELRGFAHELFVGRRA